MVRIIFNRIFNFFELVVPFFMLAFLFISFIIGIISRYFFHNPLTWTYELSSICFLNLVVLSWPYVQKFDEHIKFDMFFEMVSNKMKFIFNICSCLFMLVFSIVLLFVSCKYLQHNIIGNFTQVIKIPKVFVFICFPISFFIYFFRAINSLIININNYKKVK